MVDRDNHSPCLENGNWLGLDPVNDPDSVVIQLLPKKGVNF